ncbi:MAG: hypothetical protein AAF657_13840 [Acidobacteriota bacterium]
MFKLSETSPGLVRLFAGGLLLLTLWAAPAASGAPFGDPEAASALLERLADRYRVIELSDGYLLQPADGGAEVDFSTLEVKADRVVVDGDTVTLDQLEARLGDDARTLFELSALGSPDGQLAEELRQRIEREAEEQRQLVEREAEEQRQRAEELEEMIRARAEELEALEQERRQVAEDAAEEASRDRRAGRRGRVRTDTRVSFGSSLTIEENEISQDVVVLGGSLDVEGEVRGDAVIVAGSADVQGEVSGSVTAVGGSIFLGPDARISGDAISIGGAVHREGSAQIRGEITEVSLGPSFEIDDLWQDVWFTGWEFDWFDFGIGKLIIRSGRTVVLGVLLLLLVLLFPRFLVAVADRAESEPWKSGLVGLGTQLLFLFALPVVFFILFITIVGIPLALLLFPVSLVVLVVLLLPGFAGVSIAGGRAMQRRFDWHGSSPYLLLLAGLALIQGWSILGDALGFLGDVLDFAGTPIKLIAWLLLLVGFMIKYIAWTTGLGAVLLHYLSPRPAVAAGGVPPVPPPIPTPAGWEDTAFETESSGTVSAATLSELRDQADRYAPLSEEPEVDADEEYLRAADGVVESEAETDDAEVPSSESEEPDADDGSESESEESDADDSADPDADDAGAADENGKSKSSS